MKAKLKLDPQVIKAFFIQHAEKIVLGLAGIMFCLFTYGAATRPTYDKTPGRLQNDAQQARSHVEDKNAQPRKPLDFNDWDKMARESRHPVKWEPYTSPVPWNPPLFPERHRRDVPKIYEVAKLRGVADTGQFSLKEVKSGGAAAGVVVGKEEVATINQGERWIVLTGLVPWSAQLIAYREAFRDNPREGSDTPNYAFYRVLRAEVTGPKTDDSAYTPVDIRVSWNFKERWAQPGQEVAPPAVVNERLTYPLGPLNGVAWDWRVVHAPEIPLQSSLPEPAQGTERPTPTTPVPDEPFATPAAKPPATGAAAPAADPAAAAAAAAAAAVPGEDVKNLLFRFFDFSVEPGKKYRYKVQLVLKNPNFEADVHTLRDPESGKVKYLEAKLSQPSDVIAVPDDDQVYVQSITPAQRLEELTVKLKVLKWMAADGKRAAADILGQFRGQLCDFTGQPVNIVSGGSTDAMQPADLMADSTAKPAHKVARAPTLDYKTDFLLVDFRGEPAKPETRKIASKTEAKPSTPMPDADAPKPLDPTAEGLFLTPDGRLTIQSNLDDRVELDRLITTPTTTMVGPVGPGHSSGGGPNIFDGGAPPKPQPHPHVSHTHSKP